MSWEQWWERTFQGVLGTLIYGLIGIGLIVLAFKVFDWLMPKVDIDKDLAENKNMPVAVVVAAIIIGTSIVVAVAVHG
jgi:uncharacterized membrane protein YjfL (UPF0719 family)